MSRYYMYLPVARSHIPCQALGVYTPALIWQVSKANKPCQNSGEAAPRWGGLYQCPCLCWRSFIAVSEYNARLDLALAVYEGSAPYLCVAGWLAGWCRGVWTLSPGRAALLIVYHGGTGTCYVFHDPKWRHFRGVANTGTEKTRQTLLFSCTPGMILWVHEEFLGVERVG